MHQFTFHSPTDVCFGPGAEMHISEYVKKYGRKRVLIVTGGSSVKKSGAFDRVCSELESAGIAFAELSGVKANPLLSKAREGLELAKEFCPDLILGFGGGSVIDTAKMISIGAANPEYDVWDFWSGVRKAEKAIGVAAIPTIAAAGSELSASSVITNEETKQKNGYNTELNRPIFALIDPEFLFTLPDYQVGCGCADILMHTMERFFSDLQGNYLTDEFACAVMRTVVKFTPVLLNERSNYDAASEIFWASEVSHNDLTGLGGHKGLDVHRLGHRLSADFDIAHGASLSALFGSWARHYKDTDPARFCELGRRVFGIDSDDPDKAIDAVDSFFSSIGVPVCFSQTQFGVLPDERVVKLAQDVTNGGTARWGSFAEIGYEDALDIYRRANR